MRLNGQKPMNRFSSLLVLLIFCACEQNAVDIVEKSLEYHGGLQAWKDIGLVTYQKEEYLYFENDSLESYTKRVYTHPLTEDLPIKMGWDDDTIAKIVRRNADGFSANFPLTDKEAEAYNSTLLAAPYTLW